MINIHNYDEILAVIPQQPPFRFIDELHFVDQQRCTGSYTFKKDEFFYRGHFPEIPVTPSVILIECMAQIGLIPLGLANFIQSNPDTDVGTLKPVFTDSEVKFSRPVYPETTVTVEANIMYFRINRLKAKVKMRDHNGEVCCAGTLSGIFVSNNYLTS